MNDTENPERDKRLALIGLTLGQTEPRGEPPTLLDIDEWIRGLVESPRAEEILSYVANDAEYFEQWRSLKEAEQWLDDNPLSDDEISTEDLTDTEADPAARQLAQMGLLLSEAEPRGEPPTLLDIDDWIEGLIEPERSAEILSYVANDEHYFNQWRALRDAEHWLDENPWVDPETDAGQTTLSQAASAPLIDSQAASALDTSPTEVQVKPVSSGVGKVFAKLGDAANLTRFGAIAAGLLALLVIPLVLTERGSPYDSLDQQYQQYIALGAPAPSAPWAAGASKSLPSAAPELHAFRSGVAQGISQLKLQQNGQWSEWLGKLPAAQDHPCVDDNCSATEHQMQALGRWSLLTHLVCHTESTAADIDQLKRHAENWAEIAAQQQSESAAAQDILALEKQLPDICERAEAGLFRAVSADQ